MIKTLFPVHLPEAIAGCILDYSRAEWIEARARAQGAAVKCRCAACKVINHMRIYSVVQTRRQLRRNFEARWHRYNECNLCHSKRLIMTNPKMLWSFPESYSALRWWLFHSSPCSEEDLYVKYAAKMHGFFY